jgi:hypothetical protein
VEQADVTAKTSTERAQELRQRRAVSGLSEVRGIWAPAKQHDEVRAAAAQLQRRRERAAKKGTT